MAYGTADAISYLTGKGWGNEHATETVHTMKAIASGEDVSPHETEDEAAARIADVELIPARLDEWARGLGEDRP